MKAPNVATVRDSGLCLGCGTCESVCPVQAIVIKLDTVRGIYLPLVDQRRCTGCGLCLEICPGLGVNIEDLSNRFLDGQVSEKMLGTFDSCYVGHATSKEIRYNSSSGGIVTALLCYAIENGMIDGALTLGMSDLRPLETKPCLATTVSDIVSSSGSKYCPSAVNTGVRSLLAMEGRFAVVGLPCHIQGIRKLERAKPMLREKIVLHLGLFCALNNTYLGTEYFLRQQGIAPEDVRAIRYRGEGWPGKISVTLSDGTQKLFPRRMAGQVWHRRILMQSAFRSCFAIPRCLLCVDQTSELADIACGDPWTKELLQTETIGKSLVMARNKVGLELLSAAKKGGAVVLEDVPTSFVRAAQNYDFKKSAGARIRVRKAFGLATPDYAHRDLSSAGNHLVSQIPLLPAYFSHHRLLWPLLWLIPTLRLLASHIYRSILRLAGRSRG